MIRADDGAGAVLAVAVVGAIAIAGVTVLGAGSALAVRQRIIGAADAAALAAADAASGAVPGSPCDLAAQVARANGAVLTACHLDGLIATVDVSGAAGPLTLGARSTAGPPP